MKRVLSTVLSILLCITLLASCGPAGDDAGETAAKITPKNRVFEKTYFNTVCVFYDYTGGTQERFFELCELIEAELEICNKLFDIYNDYEGIINIKTINDNAGGELLAVDSRIVELLTISKEMHAMTDGNVNVAMGAVLSIWHEHRESGVSVPSMETLLAAAEHTSIDSLVIDSEGGRVGLTDPDASLDVGATAKGYAAERVAKLLEANGVYAYALEFGGNLRVGEKVNGDGWVSGIRDPNPLSETGYIRKLTVKQAALVTSGTYERFYTVGGVRYHHIINKDTLMPENIYTSVSVMTPSSAVADALSTAFFNMSVESAQEVIDQIGNTEVTYLFADERIIVIRSAG